MFTDEETYSSSSLLNQHFNLYEPSLQQFLERMRKADALPRLLHAIDGLQHLKVLVVGETIVDEYQYVSALGRPSKDQSCRLSFNRRRYLPAALSLPPITSPDSAVTSNC